LIVPVRHTPQTRRRRLTAFFSRASSNRSVVWSASDPSPQSVCKARRIAPINPAKTFIP